MAGGWWADKVYDELSQGDVLAPLPVFTAGQPTAYLKPKTLGGGVQGWIPDTSPKAIDAMLAARGVIGHVLVVSHDCEMDKGSGSKSVQVAPIRPMSEAPHEHRDIIVRQSNLSRIFLPAIPNFGDGYANLRQITTLNRKQVDDAERMASMTEEARWLLKARIVAFFTRLELPGSEKTE